MVSRNEVWKTKGVSTFSLGVLVRGHGIHITPSFSVLVVIELELHQNSKAMEPGTKGNKLPAAIRLTLGCLDTPFDKIDKTA